VRLHFVYLKSATVYDHAFSAGATPLCIEAFAIPTFAILTLRITIKMLGHFIDAECVIVLNVISLSLFMLIFLLLSVFMLSFLMPSVSMLSVIMLIVVTLSFVIVSYSVLNTIILSVAMLTVVE